MIVVTLHCSVFSAHGQMDCLPSSIVMTTADDDDVEKMEKDETG